MAIFGRRQPHQPLILRGIPTPQRSVSRFVTPHSLAVLAASYRPRGSVTLIHGGGKPSVSHSVSPSGTLEAHLAARRPKYTTAVVRGGGQPSRSRLTIPAGQAASLAASIFPRRPRGSASVIRGGGRLST